MSAHWTVSHEPADAGRYGATHSRNRNANVAHMNDVDHIATARVCSLRLRGIFDGTNLKPQNPDPRMPKPHPTHHTDPHAAPQIPRRTPKSKRDSQQLLQHRPPFPWVFRNRRGSGHMVRMRNVGTHSICACRFATGLSGVVVRLLRLLSRSRSEDDETVRVADVNAFRTSIVPSQYAPSWCEMHSP